MATYAIGDVQGCLTSLIQLLNKLNFEPGGDALWFTGDLVNRGPSSAEVIRFVKNLPNCQVVLGNHDLHLLAVSEGRRPCKRTDTFQDVLQASDREPLLSWLRDQPLAHFDESRRMLMVHAGFHPSWCLEQALAHADEIRKLLLDDETYHRLLAAMYGNSPTSWSREMRDFDRARTIINAFTRIRFCYASGQMDFSQVGPPGTQPPGLMPWYQVAKIDTYRVVFGHWSMLGAQMGENYICLDSGCVHGGRLSAIDLDQVPPKFVQVVCRST